jgi:glycine/D-amino acid oxidase-like deaminating enzyme
MSIIPIKVDYIIVGCGLAGIAFAETCLSNNKSVIVFDNGSQNSSTIAAGIYNPVVLKRFTGLEHAASQLEEMTNFYNNLKEKGIDNIDHKMHVLRKFIDVEEQNNWFSASDKGSLAPYLSLFIHHEKYTGMESPFDYGEVLHTGYVDTASLLQQYKSYLTNINSYFNEVFEYPCLQINDNEIGYKNIASKHIIFAEGYGLHANPYFNHLPLDGTKGELLIIKAPLLDIKNIINSSLYLVPLGNQLFKVGATYQWDDKTIETTAEGLHELEEKLKNTITCDYEIMNHLAGIRPTVKDRKPLLGTHPQHKTVHILNGLGTRGVMLAPWCAKKLYDFIELNIEIERSINIRRFYK